MLDLNRLTEDERQLFTKLSTQRKTLKEKQSADLTRLREKACTCICHVGGILDYHWFDQCC